MTIIALENKDILGWKKNWLNLKTREVVASKFEKHQTLSNHTSEFLPFISTLWRIFYIK
jgi:hypothetical protein